MVDLELVLKDILDIGQVEFQLELSVAIHEVIFFQFAQLNEFAAAMNWKEKKLFSLVVCWHVPHLHAWIHQRVAFVDSSLSDFLQFVSTSQIQ